MLDIATHIECLPDNTISNISTLLPAYGFQIGMNHLSIHKNTPSMLNGVFLSGSNNA
jgi:hypothetical protein